jgi:hypothetical protein
LIRKLLEGDDDSPVLARAQAQHGTPPAPLPSPNFDFIWSLPTSSSSREGRTRESGRATHVRKSAGMINTTKQSRSQVNRETPDVSTFAAINISKKQRSVRFVDEVDSDASTTPPLSVPEVRNFCTSSPSTSAPPQPYLRIDTSHQACHHPHYSTSPSTTQSSPASPAPFTVTQSSGSVGVPVMLPTSPSDSSDAEDSIRADEVRRGPLSHTASIAANTVEIE